MTYQLGTRLGLARAGVVGRLRFALAIAGLLATVICGAGASRAAAAEAGVNVSNPTPAQDGELHALGTHWVRSFISWRLLQPTPGPVSVQALAGYEQVFASMPAGTKVILDVVGTPQWETGSSNEHAPPANPNDFATFVGALAQRFGNKVAAYEIWNEEDAAAFWAGGPNPTAYANLLKATYPAVKAADPSATVVLGGLTGNDYEFLEDVYAAGGKGYFDAVGVHTDTACDVLSPYEFLRAPNNRLVPDSFLAYREVHAVMVANGDEKPIWMTELSWRTTSATCEEGAWAGQKPLGVTEAQQALYLYQAYHCLAQDPYVQVALWFPLQDGGPILSGLLRADGSRKASFTAMLDYVKYGDRLTESCGVFTGPHITVSSPGDHISYTGPLPIHVTATSSIGVFRIRLEIDGKLIRNYDGASYPSTLTGAIDWMGAKHISPGWHTLTILAYDRQRNISQTNIAIFHGSSGGKGAGAGGKGGAGKGKHSHAKSRRKHRRHSRHRHH